jgi:SlyX protein
VSEPDGVGARVDALEARIAHQDRTIEDLNQAVLDQWKQIDALTRQVARLLGRVQEVEDGAAPPPDRPPPHY